MASSYADGATVLWLLERCKGRLFCVFWDKDRPFAVPATEAHVLRTRGEVQFDLATIGYYDSRCLPEWIEEDVRDFARSH